MQPTVQTEHCELYLANCRDVLPLLAPGSVDAVVTDPPYGVNFQGKNTKHTTRDNDGYASGIDDAEIGPLVVAECVRMFGRVALYAPCQNLFDYPKPVEVGSVFCPSGAGLGKWGFILTHPILYYGKCPRRASPNPSICSRARCDLERPRILTGRL